VRKQKVNSNTQHTLFLTAIVYGV